jgi:hypothetical protein
MDKDTTKSTFKEYLLPLNREFLVKQIEMLKLDKYTKKLDTVTFSKLFIYAQLKQVGSLADISLDLRTSEELQQELELGSISASQLSRKLRDLNPSMYEAALGYLIGQVHRKFGFQKGTEALGRLNLIDSSTISLCLTRYRWAEFRNTKAGIKMHTRVIYHDQTVSPDKVVLKPAKASDKTEMNELVVQEPDAMNLFDRAYLDYELFDEYCGNGTRFVTRLKGNAVVTVFEEKVAEPDGPILREAIVHLGKPGVNQMKHALRLIETKDSEDNLITIITNDMAMGTTELADLYRYRWHIELFFKWIKQHLYIKRFYGTSANAVYTQIRIALITYCLLLLMQRKIAYRGKLLMVYKIVQRCWDEPMEAMIRKLYGNRTRTSRGRRTYDHERIFAETLQQFEIGDTDHLNDTEYDPVI